MAAVQQLEEDAIKNSTVNSTMGTSSNRYHNSFSHYHRHPTSGASSKSQSHSSASFHASTMREATFRRTSPPRLSLNGRSCDFNRIGERSLLQSKHHLLKVSSTPCSSSSSVAVSTSASRIQAPLQRTSREVIDAAEWEAIAVAMEADDACSNDQNMQRLPTHSLAATKPPPSHCSTALQHSMTSRQKHHQQLHQSKQTPKRQLHHAGQSHQLQQIRLENPKRLQPPQPHGNHHRYQQQQQHHHHQQANLCQQEERTKESGFNHFVDNDRARETARTKRTATGNSYYGPCPFPQQKPPAIASEPLCIMENRQIEAPKQSAAASSSAPRIAAMSEEDDGFWADLDVQAFLEKAEQQGSQHLSQSQQSHSNCSPIIPNDALAATPPPPPSTTVDSNGESSTMATSNRRAQTYPAVCCSASNSSANGDPVRCFSVLQAR